MRGRGIFKISGRDRLSTTEKITQNETSPRKKKTKYKKKNNEKGEGLALAGTISVDHTRGV